MSGNGHQTPTVGHFDVIDMRDPCPKHTSWLKTA